MLVATRPLKKPAFIIGVGNRIVQRLPMEGAIMAGASWRKVTTELQDQS